MSQEQNTAAEVIEPFETRADNNQRRFRFDNGYGASVICGPHTYGGPAGLFELAVVVYEGDDHRLTYDTPITDDVIGYLSEAEVQEKLREIRALPAVAE